MLKMSDGLDDTQAIVVRRQYNGNTVLALPCSTGSVFHSPPAMTHGVTIRDRGTYDKSSSSLRTWPLGVKCCFQSTSELDAMAGRQGQNHQQVSGTRRYRICSHHEARRTNTKQTNKRTHTRCHFRRARCVRRGSRLLSLPCEPRQEVLFLSMSRTRLCYLSSIDAFTRTLALVCKTFKTDVPIVRRRWLKLLHHVVGFSNNPVHGQNDKLTPSSQQDGAMMLSCKIPRNVIDGSTLYTAGWHHQKSGRKDIVSGWEREEAVRDWAAFVIEFVMAKKSSARSVRKSDAARRIRM
jgi:hypothetical protein